MRSLPLLKATKSTTLRRVADDSKGMGQNNIFQEHRKDTDSSNKQETWSSLGASYDTD